MAGKGTGFSLSCIPGLKFCTEACVNLFSIAGLSPVVWVLIKKKCALKHIQSSLPLNTEPLSCLYSRFRRQVLQPELLTPVTLANIKTGAVKYFRKQKAATRCAYGKVTVLLSGLSPVDVYLITAL